MSPIEVLLEIVEQVDQLGATFLPADYTTSWFRRPHGW